MSNMSDNNGSSKNNIVNSTSCLRSDGSPTYTGKDNAVGAIQTLPSVNLPEKILFVIDTVRERSCTPFKLSTGAKYAPLFMVKRVVENFICIKSTIQRSHEYALMILNSQGAQWICDFTSNIKSIVNQLDVIDEDVLEEDQESYDFDQAFDKIQSRLQCSLTNKHCASSPPSFVFRVILIYSRSNSIPRFCTDRKCLDKLTENPYFFMDALYVHEPPSSENSCEKIYGEIAKMDTTNFSYILEVGRNAAKLHDNMAKLLAHPLQRPPQRDACYTIHSSSGSQEVHTNV